MGQGNKSRSSRYWPTTALLDLAQAHGLTAANIAKVFPAPQPKCVLKQSTLVQLKPFKRRAEATGEDPIGPHEPVPWLMNDQRDQDDDVRRLVAEVEEHNAFVASHKVTFPVGVSCYPPQWRRVFRGRWILQRRWYPVGGNGDSDLDQLTTYASLPSQQRAVADQWQSRD